MNRTSVFRLQVGVILLSLLALGTNTYSAEEKETYHFRQTRWGMSREDVRKAENGEPNPEFSHDTTLVWRAELLGERVVVAYTFVFNKLVRAKYMLVKYSPPLQRILYSAAPKQLLPGEFILDFDKFKKALIEKYGQPDEHYLGAPNEVVENKNNDPETLSRKTTMIDAAIRANKTAWYSKWKTKDTSILLLLRGDSGHMNFEIGYSSTSLKQLEEKAPL
jgi:hypothetical protein